MSKERLKEIKKRLSAPLLKLGRMSGKTQLFNDLQWLIEQVELFQQERDKHALIKSNIALNNELQEMKSYVDEKSKERANFNYYLQKNMPKKLIPKVLGGSVIESAKKLIEHQKDELETLSTHNNDLLHEIRVLKNKIATFNKIYDEQLRIDGNES